MDTSSKHLLGILPGSTDLHYRAERESETRISFLKAILVCILGDLVVARKMEWRFCVPIGEGRVQVDSRT